MEENVPAIKTNKTAVVSLVTAILAPISYCVASWLIATVMLDEASHADLFKYGMFGVGIFFYALAPFVLGVTALVSGISALSKIKLSSEGGKGLAVGGIVIGGLVTASFVCIFLSVIVIFITNYFKTSL